MDPMGRTKATKIPNLTVEYIFLFIFLSKQVFWLGHWFPKLVSIFLDGSRGQRSCSLWQNRNTRSMYMGRWIHLSYERRENDETTKTMKTMENGVWFQTNMKNIWQIQYFFYQCYFSGDQSLCAFQGEKPPTEENKIWSGHLSFK